uniref:Uncharacterized protein n=1 Tax=Anopheles dirus TaxID=7168 RepID=A0A182NGZ8_9DIPT
MLRAHRILLLVAGVFCLLSAAARGNLIVNGVNTSRQSYFFGAKDASDILCYSKTLLKGSVMPQDVTYTNPAAGKNINFITLAADKYSSHGFTVDIASGKIGTTTVTLRLNGKSILPYSIQIKYYCSEVGRFSIGRRKTSRRKTMFALKLVMLCALGTAGAWALSYVVSQEQSFFFGRKPTDNLLCYTKTIGKGSGLPVSISYTNPNNKNINFVTMNADKYSSSGYTVDKTEGQIGSPSIAYRLNGPSVLSYAIIINMYCAP